MFFFLVVLVLACAPDDPASCDGTVIEVSTTFTTNDDGTVRGDACAEGAGSGYDYGGCCPEGYVFLAVGTGGILCEEDCNPGVVVSS